MRGVIGPLALALSVLTLSVAHAADPSPSALNGYGQGVASQGLLKVMTAIQKLDQGGMLGLQVWAGYPKPSAPDPVMSDLDQIETEIVRVIAPSDREAIFSWLNKGGRTKLYARGLSDSDIGPCVELVDVAGCRSSATHPRTQVVAEAFHDLPLTLVTESSDTGGISIQQGFAVLKSDASSETHCLTFKNAGSKKADAVTFVYKYRLRSGAVVFAGSNIRSGSFEPGATIAGPADAADLAAIHTDGPDKALLDNCWSRSGLASSPALARAASISIAVASVTYDDGTHWAPQP